MNSPPTDNRKIVETSDGFLVWLDDKGEHQQGLDLADVSKICKTTHVDGDQSTDVASLVGPEINLTLNLSEQSQLTWESLNDAWRAACRGKNWRP